MKYIDISNSQKAKLRRTFRCSAVTVWSALTYQTNSDLAKKIRHTAISQSNGVIRNSMTYPEDFCPNCATQWECKEGKVIAVTQIFANGVKVDIDLTLSRATIYRGDAVYSHHADVKLEDWADITFEAQQLNDEFGN